MWQRGNKNDMMPLRAILDSFSHCQGATWLTEIFKYLSAVIGVTECGRSHAAYKYAGGEALWHDQTV